MTEVPRQSVDVVLSIPELVELITTEVLEATHTAEHPPEPKETAMYLHAFYEGYYDIPYLTNDFRSMRLVCSSWNIALKGATQFWNRIRFDHSSTLLFARTVIRRSGDRPLWFYIGHENFCDITDTAFRTWLPAICIFVGQHMHRTERIAINLDHIHLEQCLHRLTVYNAPQLRYLYLKEPQSMIRDAVWKPLREAEILFGGSLRSFKFLLLDCVTLKWNPLPVPTDKLTHLCILQDDNFAGPREKNEELTNMILACPMLLHFAFIAEGDSGIVRPYPFLSHPSLKSLTISSLFFLFDLPKISMSNLDLSQTARALCGLHLHVELVCPGDLDSFFNVLANTPLLENLTLELTSHLNEDDVNGGPPFAHDVVQQRGSLAFLTDLQITSPNYAIFRVFGAFNVPVLSSAALLMRKGLRIDNRGFYKKYLDNVWVSMEPLPMLTHLHIGMRLTRQDVEQLLGKCPSLQTLSIDKIGDKAQTCVLQALLKKDNGTYLAPHLWQLTLVVLGEADYLPPLLVAALRHNRSIKIVQAPSPYHRRTLRYTLRAADEVQSDESDSDFSDLD
ncbi:hypothetical protein SISNIDRAFT_498848 [Sistotremastrum niveocremeum HHB9708]|uniref:F-box domain-containing protein n=1 Tax=Sistotremastrum niveocremeum HHB9708 TaxID=1314777 RepID=A0A165AB00_9AGAM|nr:hypothetical protein SISNIDRAFT_498848 [Sistotremastrum niveocremeum HHB9708]